MDQDIFLEMTNKAFIVTAIISVPILIPGLIAGLLISLFQAVTQISEQTLTFVPKFVILIASYFIAGPWIVRYLVNYTEDLFMRIPEMVNTASTIPI
jgi:flagellar biosynthesis protein FliQ